MGWLYLYQVMGVTDWQDVSRSGYGCECMGSLYLGQDSGMMIWAGCIYVRIGM
jgi:hypothetical protein